MKKILLFILIHIVFTAKAAQKYDVVVYGGTPAGVVTSINLAQKGNQVLLIEPTEYIGGMYVGGLMTSEIMHMVKGCISGMAKEYYIRLGYNTPVGYFHKFKHGKPAHFFECKGAEKTFLEWLKEYEENIDIQYGQRVNDVKKKSGFIKSVTLENKKVCKAEYFVDCSYEGDLMRYAKVSFTTGREAQSTYNESYAGIRFQKDTLYGTTVDKDGKRLPYFKDISDYKEGAADPSVAAYNFRCVLTKVKENQLPFYKPSGFSSLTYEPVADYLQRNPDAKLREFFGVIKRGNGKTGFNSVQKGASTISVDMSGMHSEYPLADYEKRDEIRANYKAYTQGLFYFLSHDNRVPEPLRNEMRGYGYAKDEFIRNNHFPYYFYIREGLRLKGEYVMTEHDLLTQRTKEDAVLLGSHYIDCHSIQKMALSDTSYIKEGNLWVKMKKPYEIPYRAILPIEEECKNLLVPVCISSSHVAFCSIRLESTWMQLGHASAIAIGIAKKTKKNLHEISIEQLQKELRAEKMIVKLEELKVK